MNETQLQIVITAINDAQGALTEVGTALSGMSEQASAAASSMTASMDQSFNAIESAAIAAAEATLSQWDTTASDIEVAASGLGETFGNTMEMMNSAAASAAEASAVDWQASIAQLQTELAALPAEAATAGTEAGAELAGGIESSVSSLGGKLTMAGVGSGLAGGLLTGGVTALADAAGKADDAMGQLALGVQNVYANAGQPNAAYQTEITKITTQIEAQKASILGSQAALMQWNGTTLQVAANHEKAAVAITTAQNTIAGLTSKLELLQNQNNLVGQSSSDAIDQFKAAANGATQYGFMVADSAQSIQNLFENTNDVNLALGAFQDAQDISAATGKDLTTSTNAVIQAMQGNGKGLRDVGVQVQDNLSGTRALAAIHEQLGGAAARAATEGLGPFNASLAQLNKTSIDAGNTILPLLTNLVNGTAGFLKQVDAFVTAHPKITEALLAFTLGFGSILVLLSPLLIGMGYFLILVETFNTLSDLGMFAKIASGLDLLSTGFWAIEAPMLLVAAEWLVLAGLIFLFYEIWKNYGGQIIDEVTYLWGQIKDLWEKGTTWLGNLLTSWSDGFSKSWSEFWNGIYTFLEGIWNKIQTVINSVLSAASKVGGAISGVTGAVGGAVGSAFSSITHVNDAIITPSGGIIQTDPADYLIATKTPGALAGGGGSVNVYIQGGSYLDSNGATMIANALARQIQMQMKLKNFF